MECSVLVVGSHLFSMTYGDYLVLNIKKFEFELETFELLTPGYKLMNPAPRPISANFFDN